MMEEETQEVTRQSIRGVLRKERGTALRPRAVDLLAAAEVPQRYLRSHPCLDGLYPLNRVPPSKSRGRAPRTGCPAACSLGKLSRLLGKAYAGHGDSGPSLRRTDLAKRAGVYRRHRLYLGVR